MSIDRQVARQKRQKRVLALLLVVLAFLIVRRIADFHEASAAPDHVAFWGSVARRGQLKVGDFAPDFRLVTSKGGGEVRLSSLRRTKPIVLIFGSYTCPNFRGHASAINELYGMHKQDTNFFFVYIREAHPEEDGRIPENNGLAPIHAATCLDELLETATTCATALKIQMPTLLDELDGRVAAQYRAWPESAYIVDEAGRIAYMGDAPGSIDCRSLGESLDSFHR